MYCYASLFICWRCFFSSLLHLLINYCVCTFPIYTIWKVELKRKIPNGFQWQQQQQKIRSADRQTDKPKQIQGGKVYVNILFIFFFSVQIRFCQINSVSLSFLLLQIECYHCCEITFVKLNRIRSPLLFRCHTKLIQWYWFSVFLSFFSREIGMNHKNLKKTHTLTQKKTRNKIGKRYHCINIFPLLEMLKKRHNIKYLSISVNFRAMIFMELIWWTHKENWTSLGGPNTMNL